MKKSPDEKNYHPSFVEITDNHHKWEVALGMTLIIVNVHAWFAHEKIFSMYSCLSLFIIIIKFIYYKAIHSFICIYIESNKNHNKLEYIYGISSECIPPSEGEGGIHLVNPTRDRVHRMYTPLGEIFSPLTLP